MADSATWMDVKRGKGGRRGIAAGQVGHGPGGAEAVVAEGPEGVLGLDEGGVAAPPSSSGESPSAFARSEASSILCTTLSSPSSRAVIAAASSVWPASASTPGRPAEQAIDLGELGRGAPEAQRGQVVGRQGGRRPDRGR